MTSTRGQKSATYDVGDKVLCYEPDESKARVLYDSKVLDIDWTRDEGGKRVAEYLVHFTGWNNSWDRWAPEDFILSYTEDNLELQERLQQEAMEKVFPSKDLDTARKWLIACRIEFSGSLKNYNFKHKVVCGLHFTPTDYEEDLFSQLMLDSGKIEKARPKKLKDKAVPTLNLFTKPSEAKPKPRATSIQRAERTEKQAQKRSIVNEVSNKASTTTLASSSSSDEMLEEVNKCKPVPRKKRRRNKRNSGETSNNKKGSDQASVPSTLSSPPPVSSSNTTPVILPEVEFDDFPLKKNAGTQVAPETIHVHKRSADTQTDWTDPIHNRSYYRQVKKRKKKKTIAELVREAKRKKREDSSSATSSTADSDASDESSSDDYDMTHKEVPITLPEPLRAKLEDDCYFISYKNQLIKLPCSPTILTVLESYVEYFASKHPPQDIVWPPTHIGGISAMAKEPIPPPPLPIHNFELVKEVMDGLRVLFDFTIGTNLLYASEKAQYNRLVAASYISGYKPPVTPFKKRGRGRPPKIAKTPSPPILEPQTIPDFPKTTKESPVSDKQDLDQEEEEEREETPPRRITRRLSCSALNNPAQTETRLRQRSESGSRVLRKTRSESVTSDSSGGHPTPRPGLRHSARLSSHGSTAPPEITPEIALPTRERKKSESDSKTHLKERRDKQVNKDKVKPAQTHKDKIVQNKGGEDNKENCKQANSDQGSSVTDSSTKGTYSCKILADDANYNGRTPPVKIYGAQHLLRLFVKLPEILGKMDLPPKKLKPLVKHLEMFLKYLSAPEQLEAFFPDSAYQKS